MRYAATTHPSHFRCKRSGKQLPGDEKTEERKEKIHKTRKERQEEKKNGWGGE